MLFYTVQTKTVINTELNISYCVPQKKVTRFQTTKSTTTEFSFQGEPLFKRVHLGKMEERMEIQ